MEPGWPSGKAHAWKACSLWDPGFKSLSWRFFPDQHPPATRFIASQTLLIREAVTDWDLNNERRDSKASEFKSLSWRLFARTM